MAANPSYRLREADADPSAGRGLIEGSWVRQPLWILLAHSAVLNVGSLLLAGLLEMAAVNAITVGFLGGALALGDPSRRAFRACLHAANATSIVSLLFSVFVVGMPGSLILYYAPILLIATAHLLGARAAIGWAIPVLALVVGSEFVPASIRLDPPAAIAIVTESGIVLTVLAVVVSLRRAYDRKAVQLERLATTDPLTGLANRIELQPALRHALSRAERFGRHGALVFIDLDGLKAVNDRFGHDSGDALLREQAGRLRKLTRGIDIAARLGGDEFVVLLSEYEDPKGAEVFSRKLLAALRQPYRIAGETIAPSASIGFAEFPSVADTAEALLSRADEAMYAAKEAGGSRIYRAQQAGLAEIA